MNMWPISYNLILVGCQTFYVIKYKKKEYKTQFWLVEFTKYEKGNK